MTDTGNNPLIVVAMPGELRHALEASGSVERRDFGPWPFWSARLQGCAVSVLLSGIGMVNAGAALARSLCSLEPSAVINYGCAGAHHVEVHPGDVVVGTRYVHHRSVTLLSSGDERHSGTPVEPEDPSHWVDAFEADSGLIALAKDAAGDWFPETWPDSSAARAPSAHFGPITSADIWTQAVDEIDRIHGRHGTLCEDMEAAALAHISMMHRLPFLAIKDISNNELHESTDIGQVGGPSLTAVESEVGKRSFHLLLRVLERLV